MRVTVFTDGAVRTGGKKGATQGRDGRASCACVVKDGKKTLTTRSVYLGTATVNEAEYSGLILGLRTAYELGATHVDVMMDSQLVINQMNGIWRCKEERLQDHREEALDVAYQFEEVTYTWVRREYNQHADKLTGEVLDERP